MAFINDSWFKLGDEVMNKKIVHIGNDFIELKSDNEKTKLWMYSSGIVR